MDEIFCINCHANWSQGQFTADCEQCGGGALERDCPKCSGTCGSRWKRAILDSWDSGIAHWVGMCTLQSSSATPQPPVSSGRCLCGYQETRLQAHFCTRCGQMLV